MSHVQASRALPRAHRPVPARLSKPASPRWALGARARRRGQGPAIHHWSRLPRPRTDQRPWAAPLHLPSLRSLTRHHQHRRRNETRSSKATGPPLLLHRTSNRPRAANRHLRTLISSHIHGSRPKVRPGAASSFGSLLAAATCANSPDLHTNTLKADAATLKADAAPATVEVATLPTAFDESIDVGRSGW